MSLLYHGVNALPVIHIMFSFVSVMLELNVILSSGGSGTNFDRTDITCSVDHAEYQYVSFRLAKCTTIEFNYESLQKMIYR